MYNYFGYGVPYSNRYIHKKFAFHLYNMGVLWYDLKYQLYKTLYQGQSKTIIAGYKVNFLHLKKIPRTFLNRVGLIKTKLKKIC